MCAILCLGSESWGFGTIKKYNQYGNDVLEMIEKSNGQIRFLGKIDNAKLPVFYQNASALIFASSCECCPNILLEKMASVVPVFCSDIPPMPEFGGPDAFYFSPYKAGDLQKQFALHDIEKAETKEAGIRLRERAVKIFDSKETVSKTIHFITSR